jgi:hypothetical protein
LDRIRIFHAMLLCKTYASPAVPEMTEFQLHLPEANSSVFSEAPRIHSKA